MKRMLVIFYSSCFILVFSTTVTGGGWFSKLRLPWQRRNGRVFINGVGSSLEMSPGDVIVSSMKINSRFVIAPYRWFYALDSNRVVSFLPSSWKKFLSTTQLQVINLKDTFPRKKLQNRGKKKDNIGAAGILVAALMIESKKTLPFHGFWCYGKHYVEYLSRGKAEGRWYKTLHHRMNKSCPLTAKLTADMAPEIFRTMKFVLKDKRNHEIPLEIDKWPDYVVNLGLKFD